ncbi:MAG: hypothetical protein IPK83_10745 [Planctomycetes bacterium]|nr:hypothetical protein [Planctomycetota bacterium]
MAMTRAWPGYAYQLNGCPVDEGVSINARFKAHNGVDVTDVTLELPTVPLSSIGLESAVKGRITTGNFSGMIRYSNPDPGQPPEVRVSGRLGQAELAELTRSVPFGPFDGRIDVNVESARFSQSMLTHLRGGGSIERLSFAGFAPVLGVKALSGEATFSFDPVDIGLGNIHRLRVAGAIHGVQLEEIVNAVAEGNATGLLTIRVNNIDIASNIIKSADLEIIATPPKGQPGTIDRALLLSAARKFLNLTWPDSLPESILPAKLEYAEFGMRLLVRDNQLRILGTHGSGHKVILTIRVFGQTFGVVSEPADSIGLSPWIEATLERVRTYDPRRVGEILKGRAGSHD